jgi:hypothetical protein
MNKSADIAELAKALAHAQAKMRSASKDVENTYFKSNYADLASCWDAIREPLTSNGLSVVQVAENDAEGIAVETILLHTSGQWVSGRLVLKPLKSDPQSCGSAVTYARRYGLMAICGLAADDDDGNAANGRGEAQTEAPKRRPKADKPDAKPPAKPWGERTPTERATIMRAAIEKAKADTTRLLELAEKMSASDYTPGDYDTLKSLVDNYYRLAKAAEPNL